MQVRLSTYLATTIGMFGITLGSYAIAAPPTISSMQQAAEYAAGTWEQTRGTTVQARRQGIQTATTSMGSSMTSIDIYGAPAFGVGTNAGDFWEFGASMSFEVGPGFRRTVAAYNLQSEAIASQAAADQWVYVAEAETLYAQYVSRAETVKSLETDIQALQSLIQGWQRSGASYVSSLDILDAQAELLLLQQQLSDAQLEVRSAQASLSAHLGSQVELEVGADALATSLSSDANPWKRLEGSDILFPELQALEAQAKLSEAEALRDRSRQYGLSIGAYTMWTGDKDSQIGPTVSLSIPIAPGAGDSVAIARAEAIALRTEASVRSQALQAWVQSESALYEQTLSSLQRLESEAIQQLQTRLQALESAFSQGHVPAQRVFYARRDLQEAQRQAIRLRAQLAISQSTAAGVLALME